MFSLKSVLIVDDNSVNRKILKKILGNDYNIMEAENGQEAISILKKNGSRISVVLLDVVMPIMDGYEVLRQMHMDEELSRIPVIVASGQNGEDAEVKALSLGANDYILKPYKPEIIRRRVANTIYLRETSSFVNSVQHDALTGIYSKEYFYLCVRGTLNNNSDKKYDLLCCDIERFKMVNDLYGTQVGDELLKCVARAISECVAKKGIYGRIGADGFAFLIEHRDHYDKNFFEGMIKSVSQFHVNLNVVLKYGIYYIEDKSIPIEVMYDRACLAKQMVKGKYDAIYSCYDDTLRQKLLDEQIIVSSMKNALENNEFEIYFQPKYNLKKEEVVGAEALVRWNHPEKGFLFPNEFIPLFEKNGFITDLDIYIWDQCCQKIRSWIDEGNRGVPLSVNVSRADIYNPKLVDIVLCMIEKYKLSPKHLHLEITETAYTENPEQLIEVVKNFKNNGFIIEMDDFGSGYSSLNVLSELPIDILKLDVKFIQGNKLTNSRNILSFIISLAKWLDLLVIAEGVETKEQVELLKALNCEVVQGYYYAKPLPQFEFENLLINSGFQKDPNFFSEEELNYETDEINVEKQAMIILDRDSEDYKIFFDYYKEAYQVIEVQQFDQVLDLLTMMKKDVAIVIFNGNYLDELDKLEEMVNKCNEFNVPTIILKDYLDEFVNKALNIGVTDYLLKPYHIESFYKRIDNAINYAETLRFQEEREINSVFLEMKRRAEQDSLTGLLNRTEFERRIVEYYKNPNFEGVFIILDVDNFKNINDTLGHMVGDKVLCAIAKNLNYLFPETNVISRMGGDEYAIFIPYKMKKDDLHNKMQKLCTSLKFDVAGIHISCSAGFCVSPKCGKNYEQLYHNSDMALLDAKRNGKNQYIEFKEKKITQNNNPKESETDSLLDNTSEAIFVSDAITSEIVYINEAACKIVGLEKQKCLGLRCYQVFWDRCLHCDRCSYIDDYKDKFYEEETYLKDKKTAIRLKAKVGKWDGKTVKIHYIQKI